MKVDPPLSSSRRLIWFWLWAASPVYHRPHRLAGNLTVLGSVAHLIVIERARREVKISFWEYAKTGAPLTPITIAAGVWIWVEIPVPCACAALHEL